MVDDVRRGRVPTSTAEPFVASKTASNAVGIVDATVAFKKP